MEGPGWMRENFVIAINFEEKDAISVQLDQVVHLELLFWW